MTESWRLTTPIRLVNPKTSQKIWKYVDLHLTLNPKSSLHHSSYSTQLHKVESGLWTKSVILLCIDAVQTSLNVWTMWSGALCQSCSLDWKLLKKKKENCVVKENSRLIMLLAMKMKTLINAVWLFKQTTPECVVRSALPFNFERVDCRSFVFAASQQPSTPFSWPPFSPSDTIWSTASVKKTTGLHSTVPSIFNTDGINCFLIVLSANGPGSFLCSRSN